LGANLTLEYGINGGTMKGHLKGILKSQQHKNNMSKSMLGLKRTNQFKEKMKIIALNRLPMTQQTKDKISLAGTGRLHSEESKHKISVAHKGKVLSDITRDKISKSKIGSIPWNKDIPQTSKAKDNISKALKNLPLVECPHCQLKGRGGNMKRYHFDNCKNKDYDENIK